jgi:hypothetical protein
MILLAVLVLLVVGTVSVAIGALASSGTAFGVAALASGVAVILLWRQGKSRLNDKPFVSNPPPIQMPDWERPLRESQPEPRSDSLANEIVAIDGYEDLVASEILPSLETLSIDELEAVIRRERSGMCRAAVINRAQILIDLTKGPTISEEITVFESSPGSRRRNVDERSPGRSRSKSIDPDSRRKGPDLSI